MRTQAHERRYKILKIHPTFLVDLYTKGTHKSSYEVIEDFLPDDTEIIDAELDFSTRCLQFLLYSKSFESCNEAEFIPEICPIMKTLNDTTTST